MTTLHVADPGSRARRRPRTVDLLGLPLAAGVAWMLGARGWDAAAIVPMAVAVAVGPALARSDIAERRLPNALTSPVLLVSGAAAAIRVAHGDLAPLAALACAVVLLAMAMAGGMGMGDVKLGAGLALATATLGWEVPLASLAASVVIGGVAGAAALAAGLRTVAFGPCLLAGSGVATAAAVLGMS